MLKKLTLLTASAVASMAMHSAELNINDKDLEIGAKFDVGQFNQNVEPDTMFIGASFFSPDATNSLDNLSATSIDPYFEGNFLIMRPVGNGSVRLGFGVKLNYTKSFAQDFSALPLGLELAYTIPAEKLVPMYVQASVYYAPQVLSFLDAKNYLEYRLYYNVEMIENVTLKVGYRRMDLSYETFSSSNDTVNYNSSFYFGVKVDF